MVGTVNYLLLVTGGNSWLMVNHIVGEFMVKKDGHSRVNHGSITKQSGYE